MFAVSHTCIGWRTLALHTPEMWSNVELSAWDRSEEGVSFTSATMHEQLATLILKRSGNADMSVYHFPDETTDSLRLPARYSSASLDIIQGSRTRLVKLSITVDLTFLQNEWLQIYSAPKLRELSIRLGLKKQKKSSFQLVMVPSLFGGDMPGLESLQMLGFRLPWKASVFPRTLKVLQVDEKLDLWSNYYFDPEHTDPAVVPPSALSSHSRYAEDAGILSVLIHCTELEALTIRRCSNLRGGSQHMDSLRPTLLVKLHSLTIENSISDNSYILGLVGPHKLSNLSISCGEVVTDPALLDCYRPRLFELLEVVFNFHLAIYPSLAATNTTIHGSQAKREQGDP